MFVKVYYLYTSISINQGSRSKLDAAYPADSLVSFDYQYHSGVALQPDAPSFFYLLPIFESFDRIIDAYQKTRPSVCLFFALLRVVYDYLPLASFRTIMLIHMLNKGSTLTTFNIIEECHT